MNETITIKKVNKKCMNCGGNGKVMICEDDRGTLHDACYLETCLNCSGKGTVENDKVIPNK